MRRFILGTAGHIDHGKSALVKALTGVDTDRLKEEKERGITVDLGFAEYQPEEGVTFSVVDVPGHEGFIRNMLAGATGMDLVLLVVAADEGVMPQTREHLSIVRLLAVPRIAVAITKADLVEADWLELVRDDIKDLLQSTPFEDAPVYSVSSVTGEGLEQLGEGLAILSRATEEKGSEDVFRLPIDRVFTIRGAGTVVTGTLWSGALKDGKKVRIFPGDREARVRSVQVHGKEVPEARAGVRAAVGLSGTDVGHRDLFRGQTLVLGDGWSVSWMLTCRLSLLSDTGWELEQGQRVRVHLGTAEVLARTALLENDRLGGGEDGWVQLRLEEPILARVRDHFVVRSYSPVTTLGGGRVVEVLPRKRRRLKEGEGDLLSARLGGSPSQAVTALLEMTEWVGVSSPELPQRTGLTSAELRNSLEELKATGAAHSVEDRLFAGTVWEEGRNRILGTLRRFHQEYPLQAGIPLEELRQVLPGPYGPKLAEAVLKALGSDGSVAVNRGIGRMEGFRPSLSEKQETTRARLRNIFSEAGLAPPNVRDLPDDLGTGEEVEGLLRLMERDGDVLSLDQGLFFDAEAVHDAGRAVIAGLAGSRDLGPSEFREILPLTRRHLLPVLRYFDVMGVTTRLGDAREVAKHLPKELGTPGG